MSNDASDVVREVMNSIVRADVPPLLLDRLEEHCGNLKSLAMALIDSGMDEERTKEIVSASLDSFKAELSRTILILQVTDHAH